MEPPDPNLGRVIDGRYELERRLGEGGMGSVYAARHVKLGRRVAVKIIHEELANRAEVISRFEREVEANARLEHPNVATAIDCGDDGGTAYLVMQLVEGESLRMLMNDGPMEWREASEIGAQVADALAAAHAAGVVHRDLKPGNVIVERDDVGRPRARVLDFGIASLLDEVDQSRAKLTREGHVVGTLGYMAPEQALARDTTAKADVYSLGILLWEMLAGDKLYDRSELTIASYIVQQLTESPPRLTNVPEPLAELVSRMLVTAVDERVASAEAVRDTLRMLLLQDLTPDDGASAVQTAADTDTPPAPPKSRPRPGPDPMRLAAPLAAVVAGVLMFGAALGSGEHGVRLAKLADPEAPAPEPVTVAAPRAPEPPDDMELALAALVDGHDDWRVRVDAARRLLAEEDELPSFARNVALLEVAPRCEVRMRAAEALVEEGDPRAEAVLRRRRRDRCRPLRQTIDRGLERLGGM